MAATDQTAGRGVDGPDCRRRNVDEEGCPRRRGEREHQCSAEQELHDSPQMFGHACLLSCSASSMAVRVANVRFKSGNLEGCCISRNRRNAYSRVGGLPISLEALRRTPRGSGEPSGGCGEPKSLLPTQPP